MGVRCGEVYLSSDQIEFDVRIEMWRNKALDAEFLTIYGSFARL